MSANQKSMREQLEEAFEEDEKAQAASASPEPTPTPQELMNEDKPEPPPASDTADGDPQSGTPEDPKPEEPAAGKPEEEQPKPEEGKPELGELKAPSSFTAAEREEWGKVPKAIQERILARERDYSIGIQKHAEGAKFGQAIKDTLAPYAQIMAQEGADEVAAVANLAKWAGTMRVGTPQEKAGAVAKLISMYAVDVEMLDDMLVNGGAAQPQNPQQDALTQRITQLEQMIQQGQQTVANRTAQQVRTEAEAFEADPKNEFFQDVRMDMADLMEMTARRNQRMTLQEAYERAVAMRPDIQEILTNRTKQADIEKQRQNLQDKANAASSLQGGDAGSSNNAPAPTDLRGQLEDAWGKAEDNQAGRI
jgi:hypothetical protein